MSRTYKDKPWKLVYDTWDKDREYINGSYLYLPTTKPKKKRTQDTDYHWYHSTPSWWTHEFMIEPMRAKGRMWEKKVLIEDLEDTDPPGVGNKPHIYYW